MTWVRWNGGMRPGGVANDFFTVALSGGLDRGGSGRGVGGGGVTGGRYGARTRGRAGDGGVFIHPSTGFMMGEYPVSWLGKRAYQVGEIGVNRLPPRFSGARSTDLVWALHTPAEICKDSFLRTAYGAPCVQPIIDMQGRPQHPGSVHALYSPVEICGMLGTSHRLVDTPLGQVPVIPATITTSRAMDAIRGGADASSLSYSFDLAFAEDMGDVVCGDTTFRAKLDYDVIHIMGTVNHMIVACTADQARGKGAARLIFDMHTRPALCYGPSMRINVPKNVATATNAQDLNMELPDDAPRELVTFLQTLLTNYSTALDQRDGLNATVAEQDATIAAQTDAIAAADTMLFRYHQRDIRDAIATAESLGIKGLSPKYADDLAPAAKDDKDQRGKPTVVKADGVESPIEVKRAVVLAKHPGATADRVKSDAYVEAAYDMVMAANRGPAATRQTTAGGIPHVNAREFQSRWRNRPNAGTTTANPTTPAPNKPR